MRQTLGWLVVLAAALLAAGLAEAGAGLVPARAGDHEGRPYLAASTSPERVVTLDPCDYATAESARAAWRPAERGTPPVDRVVIDGQGRLSLSLNFKTNTAWRVAWDRVGQWDLSACQAVRLRLSADGDRPAGLILYLRSAGGWYGTNFAAVPGEQTVDLPRKKFGVEGQPGGWDRIDCLRVSVLREDGPERKILLCGLEGIARPAGVAVYQNGAGVKVESGVPAYVRQMGDALDRLSIAYEIVGDEEVAAGKLAGKKVAIVPLNPVLPKESAAGLEKFVADGGRLIVCYCLPAPLDKMLGIKPAGTLSGEGNFKSKLRAFTFEASAGRAPITAIQDSWIAHRIVAGEGTKVRAFWAGQDGKPSAEPAITSNAAGFFVGHVLTPTDQGNKDRLIQEMIGELWPGMWEAVYKARAGALGQVAGFKDSDELGKATLANAVSPRQKGNLVGMLNAGHVRAGMAADAFQKGDFAKAADLIGQAQESLLRAYATSVPPKAGEFRAVWCHSPTGVAGLTWDQAVKRLADAGFNAIIPNMAWGYSAAYDSKLLPRAPGAERDQLAECVAAAKKYGVAVHVWKVNWNLWSGHVPAKVVNELRTAGRLQADRAGKPIDWLCPSNPANQKLELESMLEIAANYEVAGLHFDYIRYPGEEGCFCPGCRQRFEARENLKVANWPADAASGPLRQKYLQFRRDNITQLVAAVSEGARNSKSKVRPGIKVSAAVFPDWPSARDQVGQDWKLWVEKGYLDFVCPMQYTDSPALFEARTRQTVEWAGPKTALMPGIGATLGLSPDGTLGQVLIARRQGAAGFVLFNYERALLDHLDLLRLGATSNGSGDQ